MRINSQRINSQRIKFTVNRRNPLQPAIVDGIKGVRIPVISAVIAIAFAATDEFHQTFVPGRYGCVLDVLIDAAGSIIGLIIVYIIYKNTCKHKVEKCYNIN